MTATDSSALDRFFRLCRRWSAQMAGLERGPARIRYMRQALPLLLLDRPVVAGVLERIASGDAAFAPARGGLFENEILLYLDPRRVFSIRLYFHEAGSYTPIHDHNSWGISGTPHGALGVIRYRREDDRADKDRVQLKKTRDAVLGPGEVDVVHPLDEGIHQTGSPTGEMNVMISAYGTPVRRLYIRSFDPATGRVFRHFPAKIRQRRLAKEAAARLGAKTHPSAHTARRTTS